MSGGSGKIEAEATVAWAGWGGEVTGASGKLKAETATQVELGGPGQATNPEELLAAALANCYTSTITSLARARNVPLTRLVTRARTRLAWDESKPHHIAMGALTVSLVTPQDEATAGKVAGDARDHCPICNVLGATADVTLSVSVTPG